MPRENSQHDDDLILRDSRLFYEAIETIAARTHKNMWSELKERDFRAWNSLEFSRIHSIIIYLKSFHKDDRRGTLESWAENKTVFQRRVFEITTTAPESKHVRHFSTFFRRHTEKSQHISQHQHSSPVYLEERKVRALRNKRGNGAVNSKQKIYIFKLPRWRATFSDFSRKPDIVCVLRFFSSIWRSADDQRRYCASQRISPHSYECVSRE